MALSVQSESVVIMENFISKFGLTILCLLVIAIWGWNASKKFKVAVAENPFGDYEQPQTASILGVLGTFLGISVGLINFNPAPDAMQQSVINLLGGMTTAFFTSIFGMGISLYLKNYQANAQKNFHGVKQESNIADLIKYLEKSDAEKLNSLKNLIVGEEDTNIVHEFRNFSETLAKSNSQALIDALNDAMKDFNQKLTEQFGENFKQFNIAVGRLLEWQENYKTIIEQITQNLQTTVEGIDAVKISVEQIEKSAASMTESSNQIQNLILTANFYEQKLEKVLAEVQALGESSKSAIPNLLDFMKISYDEMKIYTEQATANINSHVNSVTNNLKDKVEITISQTNMMTRQFMNVNNSALNKFTSTTDQNYSVNAKVVCGTARRIG